MRTIKAKKRSLRWLSAFMALGLLAAACGDDDDSSNSNGSEGTGSGGDVEDIRILVTVPLTGDSAETGEDMVHGAELAAEYLNEQGGVTSGPLKGAQFVIESADDEMSTEASTTLASRYVDDDGIWTMTGFLSSGQAQAAALVANRAGLSVFSSFSCADFLTTEADNIVVVCGSLQNIARAMFWSEPQTTTMLSASVVRKSAHEKLENTLSPARFATSAAACAWPLERNPVIVQMPSSST
jgi:ABC-type branched-subunit amino acid transport system substrate-binding protein